MPLPVLTALLPTSSTRALVMLPVRPASMATLLPANVRPALLPSVSTALLARASAPPALP